MSALTSDPLDLSSSHWFGARLCLPCLPLPEKGKWFRAAGFWHGALCRLLPCFDHWPECFLVRSEATETLISVLQTNLCHTEWQDEVHLDTGEFLIAGSLEIKAGYRSEAVLPVCSLFAERVSILTQIFATRRRHICKTVHLLVNLTPVRRTRPCG